MTIYGDAINGFEKNESVKGIFCSKTESIYKVIKSFTVDDNYELSEGDYIYECNSFNRVYGSLDELALCAMSDISIEAKKTLGLITLKDFALLIQEREHAVAYGSETILRTCFVNEYDYVQKILNDETSLSISGDMTEHYIAWEEAYDKMAKFEDQGIDYSLEDLFN